MKNNIEFLSKKNIVFCVSFNQQIFEFAKGLVIAEFINRINSGQLCMFWTKPFHNKQGLKLSEILGKV